ncbi:YjbH domain-containing protein [Vibrio renipiscarius]|uniref:YjbH domain-containing protein n=1 Tax=Vibrio renipiscarius TaxID=1461322 RepID=UPI00354BBDFE
MTINRITLILTYLGLSTFNSAIAANGATWKVSQSDFGGTGLMQTPTGRMADEGEFNFGVTVNEDYQHYLVSMQLMSWLETTIRYTRVPDVLYSGDPEFSGDNLYTDKGIDFKIRMTEESYWFPETAVGVRDFGGTGLFDGEYIAATKRFGSVDFTLGLGWGYLGQSGNVTNPFCKASDAYCDRGDEYKGAGGSVDYERWFKGPASFFGGIEYQTPFDPLRVKIEYEGNDYSQDFPITRSTNSKEMKQHTPWNFGINYRLGDWGDIKLSYQRGNTLTAGLNLYTNFNNVRAIWHDEPIVTSHNSQSVKPRPSDVEWQRISEQLDSNAGYSENQIHIANDSVTLVGEQTKYRDRQKAIDRAAAILEVNTSETFATFHIVEQTQGMDLTSHTVDRIQYQNTIGYPSLEATIDDALDSGQYTLQEVAPYPDQTVASTESNWDYGINPVLRQSFGGPEAFYLYSVGINADGSVSLADNVELSGSIYFNLFDNYDKFNYVEHSPNIGDESTPRVRTLSRAYIHDNPVRLNHLQLTWFEQLHDGIYAQAYAGYLEMMFAGVGGEVLYRPLNSNWAIGLDATLISQRDPDSWFGVYQEDHYFYDEQKCSEATPQCQAYVLSKGVTGHITGYYMPEWQWLDSTLFKVSAGQFLGGDVGARVDFSKQFDSGVTVGAYATLTDLSAEEYGEGSYNKGFYISIPMDVMTIKPSTSRANIYWEPITRDGGQMLRKKYQLFDMTDTRSPWYQRPAKN